MSSGLKTWATVACVGAIRTKDGNYCGNDLSLKRLLHQFKDIAVV